MHFDADIKQAQWILTESNNDTFSSRVLFKGERHTHRKSIILLALWAHSHFLEYIFMHIKEKVRFVLLWFHINFVKSNTRSWIAWHMAHGSALNRFFDIPVYTLFLRCRKDEELLLKVDFTRFSSLTLPLLHSLIALHWKPTPNNTRLLSPSSFTSAAIPLPICLFLF